MLDTSEERVRMLKTGLVEKQIEEMYIEKNDIKIVNPPIIIDLVEISEKHNKRNYVNCESAVEYAQTLCAEMAIMCDVSKISGMISAKSTKT